MKVTAQAISDNGISEIATIPSENFSVDELCTRYEDDAGARIYDIDEEKFIAIINKLTALVDLHL